VLGGLREWDAMKAMRWGAAVAAVGIMLSGCTTLRNVSVASDGTQGNSGSWGPALDGTGRRVVFPSAASNLVPGDTNGANDVFVRDRSSNTTQRVILGSGSADVSDNGRYVLYQSGQVYVRDRTTGTTTLVSHTSTGDPADGFYVAPQLSPDGSMVVFASDSTNLPGAAGRAWSVYLFTRANGVVTKLATTPDCPSRFISYGITDVTVAWATQRFAFVQLCSASIDGEEADLYTGTIGSAGLAGIASVFDEAASLDAAWADDGSVLAWAEYRDCGRCVSQSAVLKTWEPGQAVVTVPTALGAFKVAVSGDGRYLAYERPQGYSAEAGYFTGYPQIEVLDRMTGHHVTASHSLNGGDGNNASVDPAFSTDGSTLAFVSGATDLVPNDRNGYEDVFVTSVPGLFAGTATTSAVSG
jgi:Tol biopolymer transport system component